MTVRIAQPHVHIGDPHVTSDDPSRLSIHAGLYEALVRRAPGGRFAPALAHAHRLSADARTWHFSLRDAAFPDGRRLGPEDVVRSLTRVRDEALTGELGTSGVFSDYLAGSRIEVAGPHTVAVHTPEPTADLLDLLVDIPIVRIEDDGTFSGTGPYRLEDSGADRVRLRRVHGEGPETLVYEGREDPVERHSADIGADVLPGAPGEVRSPTTVCTSFICNLAEGPCAEPDFRQALNLAVDVPAIIRDLLGGAAAPLRGPLTERHLGFDAAIPGFGYDPAEARRRLKASGLTTDRITLDVPEVWPDEAVPVAERLADYYADIGIDCRIRVHRDRPAYAVRVREKRIGDAACFDSSPSSTFRVLWEKFHGGHAGPWWQGYTNPELDLLVDEARTQPDIAAREGLYRRAFRLLSGDAPWVFLYNPHRCFSVSDRLRGWTPTVDGYATFA